MLSALRNYGPKLIAALRFQADNGPEEFAQAVENAPEAMVNWYTTVIFRIREGMNNSGRLYREIKVRRSDAGEALAEKYAGK